MGRHDNNKNNSHSKSRHRSGSNSKRRNDDDKKRDNDKDDDYYYYGDDSNKRRSGDDDKKYDDTDNYKSSSRHNRKRHHDDEEEEDRRRNRDRHRSDRRHHHHRSSKHDDDDDDDSDNSEYSKHRDRKRSSRKEKRRHRHDDDDDDDDSRRKRKSSSSRHHKKSKTKDGGSNRRRREEDDSSGEERRHHGSRSRDKKRHKKDKKSSKDKKSRSSESIIKNKKEATTTLKPNPPDKSKLYPMSAKLGRKPDMTIDPIKDYFTYHEQFWVYLYRNIGIAFNDMTSEQSREYFAQQFVKEYNNGNLESEYYLSKMPSEFLQECKTTKHTWNFSNKMTDTEKKGLQQLQQNITKQTEYNNNKGTTGNTKATVAARGPLPNPSPHCQPATNSMAPSNNPRQPYVKKTPEERLEERRVNKRLRDHVRNVQEELDGGPKDFREKQLAKKREKSEKIHGGSRDKTNEGAEISDDVLYGGDNTTHSFAAALAKEKSRKEKRSQNQANRIAELQSKEKDKQENMLKMLGIQNLKPGEKITIAPRKDHD